MRTLMLAALVALGLFTAVTAEAHCGYRHGSSGRPPVIGR
jgi:hypothetical protein